MRKYSESKNQLKPDLKGEIWKIRRFEGIYVVSKYGESKKDYAPKKP
jgi:hypothetical protein